MHATAQPKYNSWTIFAALGGLAVFVAVAIFFATFFMRETAAHCKPEATDISAAELAAHGPPQDNWHVRVSGYHLDKAETLTKGFTIESLSCQVIPDNAGATNHVIKLVNRNVRTEHDAQRFLAEKLFDGVAHPISNDTVNVEISGVPQVETINNAMIGSGIATTLLLVFTIFCGRRAKQI